MIVNDYELLDNIELLFERSVILYGAGTIGLYAAEFLNNSGITIECFGDRDCNKKEYCGYKVINLNDIEKICKDDYNIILTSDIYFEEMLKDLRKFYSGCIYTFWGVEAALALNIFNPLIGEEFRKKYIKNIENTAKNEISSVIIMDLEQAIANKPQVLVYQVGKVASSSIQEAIHACGITSMHTHHLYWKGNEEISGLLKKYSEMIAVNGVKIISLVREPVAQEIAVRMQSFMRWSVETAKKFRRGMKGYPSVIKCVSDSLAQNTDRIEKWFHSELEMLTGINVCEYPFDKEKGYSIIKKGKVEVLLLTMEHLSQNEEIIGEFLNIRDFKLGHANVGNNKMYKYTYERIKDEIIIEDALLEHYYKESAFIKHFYTDEQLEKFYAKWR